jgi:polyisoprenoid-binding protein YceI
MKLWKRVLTGATLTLVVGAPARAAEYAVDPAHSKILFKVKHLGISTVTGRFDKYTATFSFDPSDPSSFKADVTIDASSVNTDVPSRDNDLRSPNFLDVAKYPEITFTGSGMKPAGKDQYHMTGELTIHGVTRPIMLAAELGGMAKDPRGTERIAFTATGTINRKDFGLTWNRVLEAGGLVVGEDVQLVIEVEATMKAAPPSP